LAKRFPDVQVYDYTKLPVPDKDKLPKNYHLTFSLSETNKEAALEALWKGFNVAVVFDEKPNDFLGVPVVDGDESDLRFLDKPYSIVGLKAKGKAKKDKTGFVVRRGVV
jgi:hypothetical protein